MLLILPEKSQRISSMGARGPTVNVNLYKIKKFGSTIATGNEESRVFSDNVHFDKLSYYGTLVHALREKLQMLKVRKDDTDLLNGWLSKKK